MSMHRSTIRVLVLSASLPLWAACASSSESDPGLDDAALVPALPRRSGDGNAPSVRQRSRGLERIDRPCVRAVYRIEDGRELELARSPDRIALRYPALGDEWLFVRNAVAPDELTGLRVARPSGHLVEYTDSDLHVEGIVDGWAELAQGFVSPEEIARTTATGEQRTLFGIEFERRVAAGERHAGNLEEVWWNEELALPCRLVRRGETPGSTVVQELIDVQLDLDVAQIPEPGRTWPDLERIDLADWREDSHRH